LIDEDDLSAEKTATEKGARIPETHEDEKRQKCSEAQEIQRKKESYRIGSDFGYGLGCDQARLMKQKGIAPIC
jgi:hypothetical protein